MSEHVRIERDGAVGILTLDRPEKLNAFIGTMREAIGDGLRELADDAGVRVVVVTGAGRAFCAGADVSYLQRLIEQGEFDEANALVDAGRRVVETVRGMPQPAIAAINGAAAGGGAALALACDLRIAAESASIGMTFNRIGLHPDWGASYHLPRLVGPARAAELFLLADMVSADEAQRIGLVNRVVPDDELMAYAMEWARRLASKPALPLALAKRAVQRSLAASVQDMLDYESRAQADCFRSADAAEGLRAFVDKRSPRFGSTTATEGR